MRKLALALAVSLLVGCAATPESADVNDRQQPQAVYQSPDSLNYHPLKIYDEGVGQQVSLTDRSSVLMVDGSESRVVGWKIPAYGVYRFKLTSGIERAGFGREASAFMAEVRLLDKDFNVVRALPAAALDYQKPGLMEQEYFYHSFVVDNRDPLLPPIEYLLVMMTDAGRQHEMMVMDQEKEYAKVRGTMAPMTADIMATASERGVIGLEAVAVMSSYVASNAPAPAYVPPVTTGHQAAVAVDSGLDTVAISRTYRAEVDNLLTAGDVVAALAMREHVDELHKRLQADFASFYQSGGGGTETALPDSPLMDLRQQLSVSYQNQLMAYFKSGNTQQALGLLDQVKSLRQHVDSLFQLPRSS